jgi:protein-L-isoaspartate(D-aspartate) O-methyltransferase
MDICSMDTAAARATMIESQVRTNDVSDLALQLAMLRVPREAFVSEGKKGFAYAEIECPTPSGRTLWTPRDFSKLAQASRLMAGEAVLVIGGAGGYSAAVFAAMGCSVTVLDDRASPADLLSGVSVVVGDLSVPPAGPFDVVFVDGGVQTMPSAWPAVLADGGRLCAVRLEGPTGRAEVTTRSGGVFSTRTAFDAQVPALPGFEQAAAFSF